MLTHRQMMPSKSEMNFFDPFSLLSSSPVNSFTSMMSSSANFDSVSSLLSLPSASSSSNNSNSQQQQNHSDSSPVVDEIWKKFDDFILTPPQSPPVKLDFSSNNNNADVDSMLEFPDLDFDLSAALDGLLEEAADAGLAEVIQSFTTNDILHDCMWGGGSSLDGCSQDDKKCGRLSSSNLSTSGGSTIVSSRQLSNNTNISQDSTHLLGTSPFSSLCNDMLACEEQLTSGDSGNSSMADDDEVPSIEDSEEDEDQSLFISGSESLIDHSYDGSCHQGPSRIQPQSRKERKASSTSSTSSSACSSLLYGDSTNSSRKSSPLKKSSSKKARTLAQQKKEELLAPVPVKFVKRSKTLSTSSTSGKAVGVSRATRKIISDNGNTTNITTSGLTPSGVKRKHQQQLQQQSVKQCKSAQAGKKSNSMTTMSSSLTPTTTSTSSIKGAVALVPSSTSSSTPASSQTSTLTVSLTPSSTLSTSILKVNADSFTHSSHKKSKGSHCYPEKRREHNDSEKKRRDHLRNAFHTLRDQIPKLRENNNKKPPRIIILYEAVNFVNQLTEKSQYLEKVKKQELEKNERLRKKLAALESLSWILDAKGC